MTWLVTGGAGYIGSHVVRAFLGAGMDCVVIDDLSSGHRAFVPASVPLIVGSVVDPAAVDEALGGHAVSGVVHLAGFKYAGVSMARPRHTYTQNVTGMLTLLDGMARHGVDEMVFSSSAAVYGTPQTDLVTESSPTRPESPYGESKLIGEWLLADEGRAANLRHTSLRYFNVVGSGAPELYDTSPHNLFPIVFDQLLAGRTPSINGDDYATPDGTCVRLRSCGRPGDLARGGRPGPGRRTRARAGLQPGQWVRPIGARNHERCRQGHRDRIHSRGRAAASR